MQVKYVPISAIKEYENNPRRISEDAVNVVAESVGKFGFKSLVVLDKDSVIVCGHTRVRAAKKAGLTEVPCIIADDLSPELIKELRLVDNKSAELTGWDFERLNQELRELEDIDIDMSAFGFELKTELDEEKFSSKEIDKEAFSDEQFEHECPQCGFKF